MIATIQETVIKSLNIADIRRDKTQSRAALDADTVAEYAELMQKAEDDGQDSPLPAPVVYFDGEYYWLADGFHRVAAAELIGSDRIDCELHTGSQRDALRHSLKANVAHGLRRTNADKRHAVGLVLADEEWRNLSNHIIGDMCGVSHPFVSKVREEFDGAQVVTVTTSDAQPDSPSSGANGLHLEPSKRIGRDGKSYPATQPPPSPDAEDPDFEYSDDADEFDTAKLEAELQQQSRLSKPHRNGMSVVSGKEKALALKDMSAFSRKLRKLSVPLFDKYSDVMSELIREIKEL